MKPHELLEIFGLLLILVSVGWELFFTITLDAIEQDIETSRLHDKIDQIHYRQFQIQKHLEYKLSEREYRQAIHGDPLSEQWNHTPHDENLDRVARQARTFRRIKAILFALGSLFLIGAKIVEYSSHAPDIQPSSAPHATRDLPSQPTL